MNINIIVFAILIFWVLIKSSRFNNFKIISFVHGKPPCTFSEEWFPTLKVHIHVKQGKEEV